MDLQGFFSDTKVGIGTHSRSSGVSSGNKLVDGTSEYYDDSEDDEDEVNIEYLKNKPMTTAETIAVMKLAQPTAFPVFPYVAMEKAYERIGMKAPQPRIFPINKDNCVTSNEEGNSRIFASNKFLKASLYAQHMKPGWEVLQLGGETCTDFVQLDEIGVTRVYIVGHCKDCMKEAEKEYRKQKMENKIKINCAFMYGLCDRWNWQRIFRKDMFDAVVFPYSYNRCVRNAEDEEQVKKILSEYVVDDGVVIVVGDLAQDKANDDQGENKTTKPKRNYPNESTLQDFDPYKCVKAGGWDVLVRGDGSTMARTCDKWVIDKMKYVLCGTPLPTVALRLRSSYAAVFSKTSKMPEMSGNIEVVDRVVKMTDGWEKADELSNMESTAQMTQIDIVQDDQMYMDMKAAVSELELPNGVPFSNGVLLTQPMARDMESNAFVVKPKVDGIRCLVVLYKRRVMTIYRGGEIKMFTVEDEWPDMTIVDTEELDNMYRVFDMYYKGKPLVQGNLAERLVGMQGEVWDSGGASRVGLIRPTYRLIDCDGVQAAHDTKYPNDGLVFIPATMPAELTKKMYTYYWKPIGDRTVDVKVSKFAGTLDDMLVFGSRDQDFGADVVDFESMMWVCENMRIRRDVLSTIIKRGLADSIVEVPANTAAMKKHGAIVRVRTDKDTPNSALTAMKICSNSDMPTVTTLMMSLQETSLRRKRKDVEDEYEWVGQRKKRPPDIGRNVVVEVHELGDDLVDALTNGFVIS